MYYFNLGAILTNANVKNDPEMRKAAVQAFDKAMADADREVANLSSALIRIQRIDAA